MPTDTQLAFSSIEEIAALFRKRKLSPVELTRFMLDRISAHDSKLNAYITVCAELALQQAKRAERELFSRKGKRRDRGSLHGIPISLKDNISTAGVRTTAGSQILHDCVPLQDAQIVAQLREAGAVLLGKTNMHEFAYGVTNNNPHFGPAHNAWDLTRIPGGSSGGSAAAVAAGLCYGSIGTDTGGSIRIPAALCGIAGLKTTFGRVSVAGTIPLSPTLDCVGPLGRNIQDLALLADAIFARGKGEPPLRRAIKGKAKRKKFRLGIPQELLQSDLSVEVGKAFERAMRTLERIGAQVTEIPIPSILETEDAGNQIAWPEATHYHQQAGWFPARSAEYSDDVRSRLELGAKVGATTYLKALEVRELFIQEFHFALEKNRLDAMISPTTPIAAPLIGEETTSVRGQNRPTRALLLRFNRPANLAGIPALSIPCGFTPEGLPIGLQLMGAVEDDFRLLEIAAAFERLQPRAPHPPAFG
jgi:aspartyl-tRNA(Asn)/glutamyl-tRNA(Gln) amidotransferase subunit A